MAVLNLTTTTDYSTDYENAGSKDFSPVPTGWYKASIFSIEVGEVKHGSPNAGKPRLKFQFKIKDGEEYGNRRFFVDINYFEFHSEKLGKMTLPFELLDLGKALGKSLEEIKNLDTDEWQGEELDIWVKVVPAREEKNGKWVDSATEKTNKVRGFRSAVAGDLGRAASSSSGKSKASKFSL